MPRSVKASRTQVKGSFTPSEMPDTNHDSVTLALTVPTRGVITRVAFVLQDDNALASTANEDIMFVHTACAAGAGEDTLAVADAPSVIASFPVAFKNINHVGGDLKFADTLYVASFALAQTGANRVGAVAESGSERFIDGGSAIYYDVSGTTKGPVSGNGPLYFSLIGDGAFDYTAISAVYVIVDIEPAS